MSDTRREIYVFANWTPINEPMLMGTLYSEILRGKEIFSFEYEESWLNAAHVQSLDPDLNLFRGPQYLNDKKRTLASFWILLPIDGGKF